MPSNVLDEKQFTTVFSHDSCRGYQHRAKFTTQTVRQIWKILGWNTVPPERNQKNPEFLHPAMAGPHGAGWHGCVGPQPAPTGGGTFVLQFIASVQRTRSQVGPPVATIGASCAVLPGRVCRDPPRVIKNQENYKSVRQLRVAAGCAFTCTISSASCCESVCTNRSMLLQVVLC